MKFWAKAPSAADVATIEAEMLRAGFDTTTEDLIVRTEAEDDEYDGWVHAARNSRVRGLMWGSGSDGPLPTPNDPGRFIPDSPPTKD